MKKTVFKGTINGKEFDNVQEYNKEMMRLLNSNEKVEANAETKTIDDECTCNCNGCNCEDGCCCDTKSVDYTPFVTTEHGGYYITLDDIIDGVGESEEKLKEEGEVINNYINKNYDTLLKAIKNWSVKDLITYADEIDKILTEFEDKNNTHNKTEQSLKFKYKDIVEKIEDLKKKLVVVEKRIKFVDRGIDIYGNVYDSYKALYDVILEKISQKKQTEENEHTKAEFTEKEPQNEKDLEKFDWNDIFKAWEEESKRFKSMPKEELSSNIKRLLKEIL